MASVTLQHVNKVYPNGLHAVRDLSVEVADGEFVVLVGPSGCGKTTTLRMIAGLEGMTSGEVSIGARQVNKLAPAERDVAMVFQDYALYPHMTVRKNMGFGLKMRRTPKAEISRRVDEAARLLSIEPLLDRLPRELSGGERQRVAVGRAIVRSPAVFLFDEPLSNLDAALRVQMRAEIAALHKRLAATMVYVTHDQVEAMTLGERLVLMRDGVVQQTGAPLEVYNQPANTFVATFIGSPAMNLFPGRVEGGAFHAAGGGAWRVAGAPEGPAALGVRPEDLLVARNGAPVFATASVATVERLGHESLAHLRVGEAACVMRLPAGGAEGLGAQAPVTIRAGHLFAADETGRRLAAV